MKNNRKWALGIGLAAIIGVAFWIRALASWRPVTMAKVGFTLDEIRVSRDGKWLLVTGRGGAVVDLEKADYNMDSDRVRAFAKEHGTEPFPHVSWQEGALQPDFWPSSGHKISLSGLNRAGGLGFFNDGTPTFPVGWSKERGEVYCALKGEIWICDWKDGKLKKRVRYAKSTSPQAVFSPDGSLLLDSEENTVRSKRMSDLRLLHVPSGIRISPPFSLPAPIQANGFEYFGFSPDSRTIWATSSPYVSPGLFAVGIANGTILFNGDATGPVHWLPDNRIGVVQENGFEWRDTKGNLLSRLPGPFQLKGLPGARGHITDWALSPDKNWIYSCEEDGTIRKWRAR